MLHSYQKVSYRRILVELAVYLEQGKKEVKPINQN